MLKRLCICCFDLEAVRSGKLPPINIREGLFVAARPQLKFKVMHHLDNILDDDAPFYRMRLQLRTNLVVPLLRQMLENTY